MFTARARLVVTIFVLSALSMGAPASVETQGVLNPPALEVAYPGRDDMVDGEHLIIQVVMRSQSVVFALDLASFRAELVRENGSRLDITTRFKVDGPYKLGPNADWYLTEAALAEGIEVPHGRHTLELSVKDKGGVATSRSHPFRFILERSPSDVIRQRMVAVAPRSPDPQAPIPAFPPFTGFTDARAALETTAVSFVDPSTGQPWTRTSLLQKAVGRTNWLTTTAPYADRVSELIQAAKLLEWRLIPVTFLEYAELSRTALVTTSFPTNNLPLDPGRGTYVANTVAGLLPGQLAAARQAAQAATTSAASSVTSLTAVNNDIDIQVCTPALGSPCPAGVPLGQWTLHTSYQIRRGVFRFTPPAQGVSEEPSAVRLIMSIQNGGWSDFNPVDPINAGAEYAVGIGLSRQPPVPTTVAWAIQPTTFITISGAVPPTTTTRAITLPLVSLFPPQKLPGELGPEPITIAFQQPDEFPENALLAELSGRIAETLGQPFELNSAGGQYRRGFPTVQPILIYRIKEFRPVVDIAGMEVTQGIQNLKNQVPLIANKLTAVRAIVRSGPTSINGLDIRLALRRPGGPVLQTLDLPGRVRPVTSPSFDRAQMASNALFPLLPALLTDALMLELSVFGLSTWCDPGACSQLVTFVDSPEPAARLIPIAWQDGRGDFHGPGDEVLDRVPLGLRHLLPTSRFATTTNSGVMRIRTETSSAPRTERDLLGINAQLAQVRMAECTLAGQAQVSTLCPPHHLGILADGPVIGVDGMAIPDFGIASAYVNHQQSPPGTTFFAPPHKTLVHEYAHLLGRQHVRCDGSELQPFGFVDPYPYPGGNLGASPFGPWAFWGSDLAALGLVGSVYTDGLERSAPPFYPSDETGDLMSYCPKKWFSDFSYKAVYDAMRAQKPQTRTALQPSFTGPALLVVGTITADGSTASLLPALTLTAGRDRPLPAPGPYVLRLLNSAGTTLVSYPFAAGAASDGGGSLFSLAIPANAQTTRLQIAFQGRILADRSASGPAPTVALTSPTAGTTATETLPIRWTATPNDGSLRYTVLLSTDGGVGWQVVGSDLETMAHDLPLDRVAGSSNARIRVLASDGVRTATAEVGPFTTPARPPSVAIEQPISSRQFISDAVVSLVGSATDLQDGPLAGSTLAWSSDRNGSLGNGGLVSTTATTLAEGVHRITLTATNTAGLTASETITIEVLRTAPPPAPGIVVEPAEISFSHFTGFSAPRARSLLVLADGGLVTPTILTSEPWLQVTPAYEGAITAYRVAVDTANLPPGRPTATITISAEGRPTQVVTVTVAVNVPIGPVFIPASIR